MSNEPLAPPVDVLILAAVVLLPEDVDAAAVSAPVAVVVAVPSVMLAPGAVVVVVAVALSPALTSVKLPQFNRVPFAAWTTTDRLPKNDQSRSFVLRYRSRYEARKLGAPEVLLMLLSLLPPPSFVPLGLMFELRARSMLPCLPLRSPGWHVWGSRGSHSGVSLRP